MNPPPPAPVPASATPLDSPDADEPTRVLLVTSTEPPNPAPTTPLDSPDADEPTRVLLVTSTEPPNPAPMTPPESSNTIRPIGPLLIASAAPSNPEPTASVASANPNGSQRVLLITEGTYPYYWGGVCTWAHSLVWELSDVDFTLMSIISDPNHALLFELPANVRLQTIPLWGTREALERGHASNEGRPRPQVLSDASIEGLFLPSFRVFLKSLFTEDFSPRELASAIHEMYRFFSRFHFDAALRSRPVWETFRSIAIETFPNAVSAAGYSKVPITLADLTRGMQLVHRWLQPLSRPLPKIDIAHAAMAGICTLVAVAAKLDQQAGFMLTEHGIYLRERFLFESKSDGSLFLKLLELRFALRTTEVSYALADLIAPCCDSHMRWEHRLGAPPDRVETLYYGIDATNGSAEMGSTGEPPTVVWVGRIDPLKDLETLIRAAGRVHETRPEIRFRLYGSAPAGNEPYYERCLALRSALGLTDVVEFAGFTNDPHAAFSEADLVVLSSISEGFPYSTLEAMVCSKPIVATDVGGVAEQIAGCGVVVEPRNWEDMATAIVDLMDDPDRLRTLGRRARRRVMSEFSLGKFRAEHLAAYQTLTGPLAGNNWFPGTTGPKAAGTTPVVPRDDDTTGGTSGNESSSPGSLRSSESRHIGGLVDGPAAASIPWDSIVSSDSALETQQPDARQSSYKDLVGEVDQRVPHPVDELEVTAVLESMGITDAIATRYGAHDVFDLAADVLGSVRSERGPGHSPKIAPTSVPPHDNRTGSAVFLVSLIPSLAVILALVQMSTGADTSTPVALLAGIGTAMISANGFLFALAPRSSLYLGCEDWASLRVLLIRATGVGMGSIILSGVAIVGTATVAGVGGWPDRFSFLVGYFGVSAFWLASATLLHVGRARHVAVGVVAGIAAGIGYHLSAAPLGESQAVPVVVGYAVAMTWILISTARLFRSRVKRRDAVVALPGGGYLVRESAPHLIYGLVFMALLLSPHALSWLLSSGTGHSLLSFGELELAINVALVPLLVSMVLAERTSQHIRRTAIESQHALPAVRRRDFGVALNTAFQGRLRLHFIVYVAAALIVAAATYVALNADLLAGWVDPSHARATQVVLASSMLAYLVLGWAHLNSLVSSSLAETVGPVRAVVTGLLMTIAISIPIIGLQSSTLVSLALLAGSTVFALLTQRVMRRALSESDYRYFAAA